MKCRSKAAVSLCNRLCHESIRFVEHPTTISVCGSIVICNKLFHKTTLIIVEGHFVKWCALKSEKSLMKASIL